MDREAVTREFNSCLLTDEEFAGGPEVWEKWEDNWGDWDMPDGEDDEEGDEEADDAEEDDQAADE